MESMPLEKALAVPARGREEARAILKSYINSRLLPAHIKDVDQAEVIVGIGREIGLPPIAAMRTIHLISGTPTVSPAMMIALANSRGLIEDMKIEKNDDKAVFTILRRGRKTPHVETFTLEDAKKLDLLTKDNYRKQAKTMLAWRAISAAMRIVFPDVIYGLYTPEEIGATVEISPDDELDGKIKENNGSGGQRPIENQVKEIMDRLAAHCGAEVDKMNAELILLTEHKDENTGETTFVQIEDLNRLAIEKPSWIAAILRKMDQEWVGKIRPKIAKPSTEEI